MATVGHKIEYAAARSGAFLACLLSARMADRFGSGLGSVAHAVLTSRRRVAFDNLKQAMGDTLSDEQIHGIVKDVFKGIGRTVVEFARFRRLKPEGMRRIVVSDGEDMVKRVYEEGNGAMFVTPHFGNWELMGAWIASLGYPTDFLVGTQHNSGVDDLLNGFRREMGANIISLAKSLRSALKAIKAGHITGMTPDQHAPSARLIMDLFGRPASMAKGPAVLAIRGGCPILPFVLRRERYDRHVLTAAEPIYPPNSGDEEADIRTMTAAYMGFFEKSIRQYPDQWMWTHKRWKV